MQHSLGSVSVTHWCNSPIIHDSISKMRQFIYWRVYFISVTNFKIAEISSNETIFYFQHTLGPVLVTHWCKSPIIRRGLVMDPIAWVISRFTEMLNALEFDVPYMLLDFLPSNYSYELNFIPKWLLKILCFHFQADKTREKNNCSDISQSMFTLCK